MALPHPQWCCRPLLVTLPPDHPAASHCHQATVVWAAPASLELVAVAPPPGRHRHSRCSSSVCVVGTQSQTGSVWPDRHPGAASVAVVGSGLRGAAGSLSLQPLQLGTSRPAWPAALPPKCPEQNWSPVAAAGSSEPRGLSCRSYPSRGWWQAFLLHE